MPGLVGGLEAQLGRLDVEGPMLHDEPIPLRTRQDHETAALGPLVTVGLSAGSPQRRNPQGAPGNTRRAEGCLERGDVALTLGATREKFTLGTLVVVSCMHNCAELETQVADQGGAGQYRLISAWHTRC